MFLQRVQPIFNEVKGKMRNKMKNIVKVWSSSVAFLLSAFSFLILITSCSNELDDTLQPVENGTLQFVVGDFPAFDEGAQTRAIGTQDEGKTAWENGDQIIVTLTSQKYGEQAAALTYDGSSWSTEASLSYLENETPTVSAVYAPCYEVTVEGVKQLRSGMQLGMCEYLEADCEIQNGTINISFADALRTYSRLRIAGLENQTLTVTTTDFTPAGATSVATEPYTLTTDEKGNAYLYGTFAEGATVNVKKGDVTLTDYTFTFTTELIQSYALDARPAIDGTLGGKAEATEDDITALVEQLKEYVDNGITTIIVPGSEPAMIDVGSYTTTAIGEAIYCLSGSGAYDENNPYNGKIDLILSDVTEIGEWEFYEAFALNSITIPKVTKLGDLAFYGTSYLQTITFGSVLTDVNETSGDMFEQVGEKVNGCNLFINCGQMKENSVPTPDLTTNTWKFKFENEFKSITLTHTGECDECKANQ